MKISKPLIRYLKICSICGISGAAGTIADKLTGNVAIASIVMVSAMAMLLFPFGFLKIYRY